MQNIIDEDGNGYWVEDNKVMKGILAPYGDGNRGCRGAQDAKWAGASGKVIDGKFVLSFDLFAPSPVWRIPKHSGGNATIGLMLSVETAEEVVAVIQDILNAHSDKSSGNESMEVS